MERGRKREQGGTEEEKREGGREGGRNRRDELKYKPSMA